MGKSDGLVRQAERTRNQLSASLDELRRRLAPPSLGREALEMARRSTAARFATNLGIDARTNAVPLAGLAVSVAWVMLNKRRQSGTAPSMGSYDSVREVAGQMLGSAASVAVGTARMAAAGNAAAQTAARSMSQMAIRAAGRISETSSSVAASARSTGDQIQQRFAGARRSTRRGGRVAMDAASAARRRATLTAGSVYTLVRNDPVFAVGIGLAMVGLAAAVFGWSRNPVDSRAVGDLADAARRGRRTGREPQLLIRESETPIAPQAPLASRIYGDDHTGAEISGENAITQ